LTAASTKHNISNIEVALRWIYYHSQLKLEDGDAVILGASKTQHLESNLESIKKGPLPSDLVELLEEIWKEIKPDAPVYHN
jgi:aflatoxin B1 aldehyde reductase